MLTVVSGEAQLRLKKLLQQAGNIFPTLCVENDRLLLTEQDPLLALVSRADFSEIHCPHAVLIARKPQDLPQLTGCARAVAVIDSANSALREAVASQKMLALTCGRSDTDTFNLTSLTADSAVISLSRSICAFDESLIEPFELPVCFSRAPDPFILLAAAAVFCLLGRRNPLAGQEKWVIDTDIS